MDSTSLRAEIWLTVYRSIYMLLVGSKPRAYLYFFLPCDLGWMIENSLKNKLYHSKSKFICLYEICVDIEQIQDSNFEKKILKTENMKKHPKENYLERSSTLRVSRAEIWLTVYRSSCIFHSRRVMTRGLNGILIRVLPALLT